MGARASSLINERRSSGRASRLLVSISVIPISFISHLVRHNRETSVREILRLDKIFTRRLGALSCVVLFLVTTASTRNICEMRITTVRWRYGLFLKGCASLIIANLSKTLNIMLLIYLENLTSLFRCLTIGLYKMASTV